MNDGTSDLFPPIEPYETGTLGVSGGHRIYWEVSGNPEGKPAVFLHGGPGAGSNADHRRFFDPEAYRIIVFDQRGAGKSEPHAEIAENTTQHLIADLEALRAHLEVEAWLVFGGSWGSTLALAYAEAHPERVTALVLRGIFLGSAREIDWFLHGMGRIFPEAHERFLAPLSAAEREDILASYLARLTDPDPEVHKPAARAWSQYEGACVTLLPSPETVASFGRDRTALSLARLEAHYFKNRVFLEDGQLLRDIDRLRDIPAVIVHGRYDIVCPAEAAKRLSDAWPEADCRIIPDAGHSAMEPGIRKALVTATEEMKERV